MLVAVVGLGLGTARAQQDPPPGPPPGEPGQMGPGPGGFGPHRPMDPEKLKELRAKIEQVKYGRMKQALAMDDETARKFFAIYQPAEKDVQALVEQRNEEMKKLGLLMNGAKTDADVDPELQKIRDINNQIDSRQQKLDGDLKDVISPRQRARLMVFEHEFNRRLHDEVMKRKEMTMRQQFHKQHPEQREKMKELMKKRHQAGQAPGKQKP